MAQHDYSIANQGFPAFRSDLNDALAAIVSNNSGATEPTTMFAHQIWVDTAANPSILKIRNADNDAWITIGSIDQTGDTFTMVNLKASGPVVFNDSGANVDFRVEGDTDANLLFVDASADRIGIGLNDPDRKLEINAQHGTNNSVLPALRLKTGNIAGAVGYGTGIEMTIQASNNAEFVGAKIETVYTDVTNLFGDLRFYTNNAGSLAERMRIFPSGALQSGPTYDLTSANAANLTMPSDGIFRRSTSSIKYKKDVEDIEALRADAILNLRPVWYRSLSEADRKDWSWYGLIAEEVAEIEPRLVHWGYNENDYEEVTTETPVERERTVTDEDGNETVETYTEVETKTERKLKEDAQLAPEGVQYDRLTVLLLNIVKRQDASIKALEARIAALEGQ